MRVTLETLDGRQYTATSIRGAFDQVRASAIGYAGMNAREYMQAVAARVAEWNKASAPKVDTRNIDTFCRSMAKAGQWSITEDTEAEPAAEVQA